MTLYNITPEGLETIAKNSEMSSENLARFVNQRPASFVDEETGINHVHIFGPLLKGAPPIYKDLGFTDYKDIAEDLKAECKGVLLIVNSPGGTVAGNVEVAELIANLTVPVVSFADGLAASAAYKLSVSADHYVATPSAIVGSVGTILSYVDYSRAMQAMGIERKAITNDKATLKSAFHTDKLSEEQEAFLREGINSAGEQFASFVKKHRDVSEDVFTGGYWSGQQAIDRNLIDEIGSFETAKERLLELITLTQ